MSFKFDNLDNNTEGNSSFDINNFDKRIDVDNNSIQDKDIDVDNNMDDRISFIEYEKLEINELINLFNNGWEELSLDDKRDICYLLSEKVADELKLENRPIILFGDLGEGIYGGYDADSNSIDINEYYINDGPETINTIIHEERHVWQHERAKLPETEKNDFDKVLSTNIDCYIDSEDNYLAYLIQPMEMDANQYASSFIEKFGGELYD